MLVMMSTTIGRRPVGAQIELAQALRKVWEQEDREHHPILTHANTKPSINRVSINRFIRELAEGGIGRNSSCLEWGPVNYGLQLRCRTLYDFRHAVIPVFDGSSRVDTASGTRVSRIHGDLQEGLAHVPSSLVDVLLAPMVFEHVPQFWRAIRVLLRITKPKGQAHEFALNLACPSHLHSDLGAEIILTPRPGYIVWATPFYYRYHPIPGDFWRFTYQGNIYLLESNDFDVRPCDCNHLITRSTSQSDVATTVYAAQKVSACVRTRGSTCTGRCSSPNQWECRSAVCGDLAECTTKS